MEVKDIPGQKIELRMRPGVRRMREKAPDFLVSLKENGILRLDQVSILGGGKLSACYLIENDGQPVVVKFRYRGVEAEAEVTKAWQEQGAKIPTIYSFGTVPIDSETNNPVKYLIQEAVLDSTGKPAPTGSTYIQTHPYATTQLGKLMGIELAKMHRAKAGGSFGGIADMWDHNYQVNSCQRFIMDNIRGNGELLHQLGVVRNFIILRKLTSALDRIQLPQESTYVHNDFGLHNVLVMGEEPLTIKVFDPNPMKADYYWDLAHQKNRVQRSRLEHGNAGHYGQCYDSLITSYSQETGETIDQRRLLANQIARTMQSLSHERTITEKKSSPTINIFSEMLHNQINGLIKL